MSKNPRLLQHLADLEQHAGGKPVQMFAVLRSRTLRETRAGKPFAALRLADRSATITAKVWDDAPQVLAALEDLEVGTHVKVLGRVREYGGHAELTVDALRTVHDNDEGYAAERLVDPGVAAVDDLRCHTLVFDIETVPATNLRKVPNTIAKAVATTAQREDSDEAKVMGLSPWFGRVVSLAVGDGEADADEASIHALVVPPEGCDVDSLPDWIRPVDEPTLLRAFWDLAGTAETVVSFNGRGFDVPFLVGRSLALGVPVTVDLLQPHYQLRPHLDLYRVITGGERPHGPNNLDVVCWALGIESPKGEMDGSMVGPAYARGAIADIAAYNRADVRATIEVYRHLRDGLLRHRTDW